MSTKKRLRNAAAADVRSGKMKPLFGYQGTPSSVSSITSITVRTSATREVPRFIGGIPYTSDSIAAMVEGLVNSTLEWQKNHSCRGEILTSKRRKYTDKEKLKILQVYDEYKNSGSKPIQCLNAIPGYESITPSMISKWKRGRSMNGKKRTGRPVSKEFEREVLEECVIFKMVTEMDKVKDEEEKEQVEKMVVVANAAYSYQVLKNCAHNVRNRLYYDEVSRQRTAKWKLDARTAKLKFSNCWVFKFLRRAHFRKRRITSHLEANVPTVTEVRKRMEEIQKIVDDNAIPKQRIFNEDETGINWAPEMKYQY